MSHDDLLERIRRGDRAAFDALFRAEYASLVGMAESLLGRRDLAEEVVQDVMLELWRRREGLAVQESLRGYLFRATRNRSLNLLRHGRVARRSEPELARARVAVADTDELTVQGELGAAVVAAVAALPDGVREVFELSRVRGLRYAEIAATLGISVKTVEARMGRALRSLRERLAPWLPGGGDSP